MEIDTTQPPYVFKCQLYDLTGVPPERQKIMVKGGLLKVKDGYIWSCLVKSSRVFQSYLAHVWTFNKIVRCVVKWSNILFLFFFLSFSHDTGRCRLVNTRSKRGACVVVVSLYFVVFFIIYFLLWVMTVYHVCDCVGSKIDDDGNSRWDSQGSREGSCFYGRSSRRRTSR